MGHILHDGCGEKKIAPKTPSGRLGWGYPDLGEACERCWGCIFFWIYVNWLVLVAWDLWNLQRHLTKPSQPMLLRIAPFFFLGSQRHIQKKIIRCPFCLFSNDSNTYFLETSFHTIWFYIVFFPGRSTRMFEVRLFWSRLGYLSTRRKSHSWLHKKVIAVKGRLLSQSLHWLVNKDPIKKLLSNSKMHKHFGVSNSQLPA